MFENLISVTTSRKCTRCESHNLRRVPRTTFIKAVSFFLPVKQYRCRKCNKNILLWKSEEED